MQVYFIFLNSLNLGFTHLYARNVMHAIRSRQLARFSSSVFLDKKQAFFVKNHAFVTFLARITVKNAKIDTIMNRSKN